MDLDQLAWVNLGVTIHSRIRHINNTFNMGTFAKDLSSIVGSLLIIGSSGLLYETEEGRIQNKLESLWIRLSDAQSVALSKQAIFIRVVADLTNWFFDRLFGAKLVSLQSVGVSACFSLASLAVVCVPEIGNFPNDILALYFPLIALLMVCGTLPFVLKNRLYQRPWLAAVIFLCFIAFAAMHRVQWFASGFERIGPIRELIYECLFLVLAIGSDTLFIIVTRWLLRKVSLFHSGIRIFGAVSGNVILAVALAALPLLIALRSSGVTRSDFYSDPVGTIAVEGVFGGTRNIFLMTLAGSNVLDAIVALAFVGLFLIMLFHRVLWPALHRPVYALASRGVIRRRKSLFLLGTVLLGLGVAAGPLFHLGRLVKQLFEMLANS